MRGLYDSLEEWQIGNQKRFLSVNIQKEGELFCCIALTNPMEVVICDISGSNHAIVSSAGALRVW